MNDSIIPTPNGDTQKPISDKLTVSKNLHDKVFNHYMKSLDMASFLRLIIAGIDDENPSENPLIAMNDIKAGCKYLINEVAELSEFLDVLHFSVMTVDAENTPSIDGGEDHE